MSQLVSGPQQISDPELPVREWAGACGSLLSACSGS